jgi:hypothetical protein
VIEPRGDPWEIADPVAVLVLKAARIDLIEDRRLPPRSGCLLRRLFGRRFAGTSPAGAHTKRSHPHAFSAALGRSLRATPEGSYHRPMLIEPTLLSLVTTYQCTAACENCCFGCHPKIYDAIPIATMERVIDEAARIPSMKVVVFTGGECFLLGKDLDALIARARGNGLKTRCVTNGYWATSPVAAAARVAKVKESGLNELNFSTGPYHAKYVPSERVAYGATAAARAGLTTIITLEHEGDLDAALRPFVSHEPLRPLLEANQVKLVTSPWVLEGEPEIKDDPLSVFVRNDPCESSLRTLSVHPDGRLLTCCGLPSQHIPELNIGSVKDRSLDEIVANTPDDLMKLWIHLQGPADVLRFVKKHDPDYVLPMQHRHICETCNHLYKDERAQAVLRSHAEEVKDLVLLVYQAQREIEARAHEGDDLPWCQC